MNTRMDLKQVAPEGYKVMLSFEKYLDETDLSKTHKNLIKLRASQLNGCSYCIDLHTKEARAVGETEQRLYTVMAWRDTPFFTPEERAILAVTEEVTRIDQRLSEKTYENALEVLGEKYLGQVLMAVIVINSWNRIGVATEMMPQAPVLA